MVKYLSFEHFLKPSFRFLPRPGRTQASEDSDVLYLLATRQVYLQWLTEAYVTANMPNTSFLTYLQSLQFNVHVLNINDTEKNPEGNHFQAFFIRKYPVAHYYFANDMVIFQI